jgi:hypothetical protein
MPSTIGLASALAELGVYNLKGLVDCCRSGLLHDVVLVAYEHQDLAKRVDEAVRLHSLVDERRSAKLASAEARAAEADQRRLEAEARYAELSARHPVALSLQIHPHLRHGGSVHRGTQTSLFLGQKSVSTQMPTTQEQAVITKQQQREQALQLERTSLQKAEGAGAVASAQAAEKEAAMCRKVTEMQQLQEATRLMAERTAREAAAAAADRAAAEEDRGRLAAAQSELASLKALATASEEERACAETRIASLESQGADAPHPMLAALSSHQKCDTDDSASRIAVLESKLAAIRHAITLANHMIIMDGQHYVAYRMGEAPHSAAGRAEQEALGIVLADL